MTFWVLTFIAEMLEVKGTLYFFDTFMEKRDGGYRNRYRFFVYCGVLYLVAVTGAWIGMLKCIPIILVMSFLNLAYYEVSFRQSFLFSIINYTMLVLIDYVTVLLGRGGSIQEKWFLQALISKTAFIILMLFIRRFSKTRKSCGLITGKEWLQFFCVPVFTVVGFILMFYSENDDMQNVFLFLSVGLETVYDKLLAGTPGKILTTCDGRGVEVEGFEEKRIAPGKGKNLITTLDVNIQKVCMEKAKEAYEVNRADGVSIIAMNPKNGEIYAMVDYPEYDLNDPFEGEDLNSMWRNSCVSDTYEPGSTFKIITASIALEENLVTLDESFYCPGYIVVEDRRIRCHKTAGHGSESFVEGIQNSCNPVFIDLGLRIGSDRYYDYFKKFGLLDKTGIDLPGEAGTIMHEKDKIGQVELATIAFGQSFQITPVQLMTTVSSLINGGTRIVPHIGMAESENNGKTVKFEYENKEGICSEKTSQTMRMLLESVVSEGSGKNAAVEGYEIGGKTATSQTFPRSDNIYIASFLGFYPADDPQIMFLVKINNPKDAYYGGTIAAPVAAELFKETIPYISTLRNDDE